VRHDGKLYEIERQDIRVGLRGADVRVEERLDGTLAVRFQGEYLRIRLCSQPAPQAPRPVKVKTPHPRAQRKSEWMKNFSMKNFSVRTGPSLRQAIEISYCCPAIALKSANKCCPINRIDSILSFFDMSFR
jgi:hypothetical protein